jgi:hypothetical protein
MLIQYKYNEKLIELKESANGDDVEFLITILDEEVKNHLKKVREYFAENNILTDVHVYTLANNRYQLIVRKDFYLEFVFQLFKQKLVEEMKWV